MSTMTYSHHLARTSAWAKGLALATLAAGSWAMSVGQAHARDSGDVYWSIGVEQPGVSVGVSNAPPPRPVIIHQPPPVVIHQPYPYVRPVVVQAPYPYVYSVAPRPVYHPGYGARWDDRHDRKHWKRHHRKEWKHHDDDRHDSHDRHDRDDDDRRGGRQR